jgi:LacI family transcriptional regulator/LacI family purine nucleotide synthesis repressor
LTKQKRGVKVINYRNVPAEGVSLAVSIKDVGREAGVSKTTVSAVLNNHSNVKPATREKVFEAITKLGYKPNITARELVTNKKLNLGIVHCVYDPYESQKGFFDSMYEHTDFDIMSVVMDEISKTKYGLLIERVQISKDEMMIPGCVKSGRAAGVFIIGSMFSETYVENLYKNIENIVTIGIKSRFADCVRNDYIESIYAATQHLIKKGHRRIAFINGDHLSGASPEKLKGYKAALKDASIPFEKNYVTHARFTGQGGYDGLSKIWEDNSKKPTGVVFSADIHAVGAVRYLFEKEIRIPEDISFVGFEDTALAEFMIPPLTTMNRNKKRMGYEACSLMMRRLEDPSIPLSDIIIPCTMIERKSVKCINLKGGHDV